MKDGETILIDLGAGMLRLKKWQVREGSAFGITLVVPSLETEHYMSPPESASTSFNAEQAAQIVLALSESGVKP